MKPRGDSGCSLRNEMEHKAHERVGGCNQRRPKQIRLESPLEVFRLEGEELRNPGAEVGKAVWK